MSEINGVKADSGELEAALLAAKPDKPEQPVYRTEAEPRLRILIPLIIACAFFMESLDSTVIATSLPQIARSLGTSPLNLSLAMTSYLLSLAVFIPISGWFADRFGARNLFCGAIVLFTVASALCGQASSLPELVATRVLQGIGAAMMSPVGRLILLRSFSKKDLVRAMSYVTVPALIGPTLGPLIGGFLTTYASWRWIFYINIPIGLVGIGLTLRYLEDFGVETRRPFDTKGFILVGLGLAALQFSIEVFGKNFLGGAAEAGLALAALATLGAYVFYAKGRQHPVLDLKLLRIRTFRISVMAGGLCRIGIGANPFLLPLLFQLGFGLNPLQSGSLTFVSTVGAMLTKTVTPTILRTFGMRRLLTGNALLVGLMIMGLALIRPATPDWMILAYLLVFGVARSLQFTCINTLGYADLSPDIVSKATSFSSLVQQLSLSLGVATGAALLGFASGPSHAISAANFRLAFIAVGLLPILSSFGFLGLRQEDGAAITGHGTGSGVGPKATSGARSTTAE